MDIKTGSHILHLRFKIYSLKPKHSHLLFVIVSNTLGPFSVIFVGKICPKIGWRSNLWPPTPWKSLIRRWRCPPLQQRSVDPSLTLRRLNKFNVQTNMLQLTCKIKVDHAYLQSKIMRASAAILNMFQPTTNITRVFIEIGHKTN